MFYIAITGFILMVAGMVGLVVTTKYNSGLLALAFFVVGQIVIVVGSIGGLLA